MQLRRPKRLRDPVGAGRAEVLPLLPMQGTEESRTGRRSSAVASSRNRTQRPEAARAAEGLAE